MKVYVLFQYHGLENGQFCKENNKINYEEGKTFMCLHKDDAVVQNMVCALT